jgi:hypothetical protein
MALSLWALAVLAAAGVTTVLLNKLMDDCAFERRYYAHRHIYRLYR